ncbi:putative 37S ribosomal protein S5, mitochondrial [Senna tora]|uniref:Putative 37S ribosomal protein S5, mitochondrial n=1 Tax=Senna tora TaxID=362788 RepID=A0A835CCT7_9FABA|nr:putative 37S ribosomal protein S5, mitochondrial [Senna tora]
MQGTSFLALVILALHKLHITSIFFVSSSPQPRKAYYSTASASASAADSDSLPSTLVQDLLAEVEKDRLRERQQRLRAGLDTTDIDAETEEDYMGVGPLIQKLQKHQLKEPTELNEYEEPTDSDSDDDDERFSPEAIQERFEDFERKFKKHEDLLKNFTDAETLDDAFKWMNRIDKFEQKHFRLRPEYRVIGELMNLLKVAEGKNKFILQQKLNRALRLVEWKEAYDPNNPANYGVIQNEEMGGGPPEDALENAGFEKEDQLLQGANDDEDRDEDEDDDVDDDDEFDDMKEKDSKLLAKLEAIDKKLEKKLAELEYTFGKKGKVLEEEIRDLAEERNSLTETRRKPLYRKGFDVKMIDVNRTCKVTKGGQVVKYTAMLACGNYQGVVGFAKAKGPAIPIALQKAYEKCFQNLHYVERHEEHTIAHAVQTNYKKTKVYLWPAPTRTGMKAGRIVQTILHLAGFKNVKSKVVGSRNPHNTVKALFKALNAIETPRDVQEKFGRTVVEKYLL